MIFVEFLYVFMYVAIPVIIFAAIVFVVDIVLWLLR